MSSSSETAYSPETSPKRMDWAKINNDDRGQYGTGPGLKDPNDPIQNSNQAYENHLEKASNAVPSGPSMRQPSNRRSSNIPEVGHFEDRDDNSNQKLSPVQQEFPPLHSAATGTANNTSSSNKTKKELEHQSTLSTLRTKIGLEAEAPIVDGHDEHQHLTWSSVRVIFREPFAEFFGTFIMVLFGDASVAQVLLSKGQTTAPGGDGFGPYQSISWG